MKPLPSPSWLRTLVQRPTLWRAPVMILLFMSLLLLPFVSSQAQTTLPAQSARPAQQVPQSSQPVAIYFFWGDGCPHCAKAKPFLATLAQRYPKVEVRAYEVWYHEQNQVLFTQMAAAFGLEPSAVPTIFIGDRYWVGYADELAMEIENVVSMGSTLARFGCFRCCSPSLSTLVHDVRFLGWD